MELAQREIIGLVPMAGRATRISPLPMSKELYPVSIQTTDTGVSPKVVSQFLLERMRWAGVQKTFIVIRDGKWDIPAYYKDGCALLDMPLSYVLTTVPHGAPFSLDAAYPFVKDATVVTGFPDILFQPDDAFSQLIEKLDQTSADVVLGLFPHDQPAKDDMVDDDPSEMGGGRVRAIYIKQDVQHVNHCWNIAVWTPRMTEFLHQYMMNTLKTGEALKRELSVGHVIQAALAAGLDIRGVRFPDGKFLDIGTPEGLGQAQEFSQRAS
jgi:glucose-1-phosphate thymidylyltransferase